MEAKSLRFVMEGHQSKIDLLLPRSDVEKVKPKPIFDEPPKPKM
jgi:hypothetical protein